MIGKHLILDIYNITDVKKLETVENIELLMKAIIKSLSLNVLNECHKQFVPIGATCLYLLSESHLSAHSFPENNKLCIDLYCCNENVNFDEVSNIVYKYFNGDCIIYKKIINR